LFQYSTREREMGETYRDETYRAVFWDQGSLIDGGLWVKEEGWGSALVLEVTDLDSGVGAAGMVLVEVRRVGFYSPSLRENVQRLRSALECYGTTGKDLREMDRRSARQEIWRSMAGYGYGDTHDMSVLRVDESCPEVSEGWEAMETVDGEDGLKQWLTDRHDIRFGPDGQPVQGEEVDDN
jgi:hypothetical protein